MKMWIRAKSVINTVRVCAFEFFTIMAFLNADKDDVKILTTGVR